MHLNTLVIIECDGLLGFQNNVSVFDVLLSFIQALIYLKLKAILITFIFGNNMIKSILQTEYHLKVFGHPNDRYVCSGVLLMNLEKMRQDDLEQKMKDFLTLHDKDADKQDQTAINSVGYDGIRFLPPEYGIFNFPSKKELDKYLNGNKYGNYTRQEIEEAIRDPTVLHMVKKPWKEMNVPFFKEWWKYAKALGNPAYYLLKQTLLDNIKSRKHFFWWLLTKLGLLDL